MGLNRYLDDDDLDETQKPKPYVLDLDDSLSFFNLDHIIEPQDSTHSRPEKTRAVTFRLDKSEIFEIMTNFYLLFFP